jgi:hypothetical protein
VVILDGASWHNSHGLVVPNNITLLALPPYSPELLGWPRQAAGKSAQRHPGIPGFSCLPRLCLCHQRRE